MTNFLSRIGLTRDSAWWLAGIVAAVIVGIAAIDESVWQTLRLPLALLPYLSWFRLGALVIGIVSGKLSFSPLAQSGQLGIHADPAKTLTTFTGSTKMPIGLLAIALVGAMSGCAFISQHGGAAHVAVVADTALTEALHLALQAERASYAQGAFSKDQHTKNLRVIKKADEDAIALTDAIAGARKIGANTQDAAMLLVTTKGAVAQILGDLSKLPADHPLVKALRAVLAALN